MALPAARSAPGSIVVTTGTAALLLPSGSSTVGLVRPTKALLVIVPPLASTRPLIVIGGKAPVSAVPP
ncbi:hypothetical protein D3C85_508010 [compost metagenome]